MEAPMGERRPVGLSILGRLGSGASAGGAPSSGTAAGPRGGRLGAARRSKVADHKRDS